MPNPSDLPAFDITVRQQIYDHTRSFGLPPTLTELAETLSSSREEVEAAYRRLAEGRAVALQPNGEILMAFPFSAVPTPFEVRMGNRSWWGNCIWDALGIIVQLRQDGQVVTACQDCGTQLVVTVRDGQLVDPSGIVHFALPAKQWWANIFFA